MFVADLFGVLWVDGGWWDIFVVNCAFLIIRVDLVLVLCTCYLCSVLAVGVLVNSVGHGNDLLPLFVFLFILFC